MHLSSFSSLPSPIFIHFFSYLFQVVVMAISADKWLLSTFNYNGLISLIYSTRLHTYSFGHLPSSL